MKKITIIILLCSIILSCNQQKKESDDKTIIVNVKQTQEIDVKNLEPTKTIKLDNASIDALVGEVNRFFKFDNYMLIHDRNKLKIFDNDGNYLGNISNEGRADNEYISLWETWNDSDTIYIYDMNGKILKYHDTVFINSYKITNEGTTAFQTLIPFKYGGYIGKQVYRGEASNELALFNSNYKFIKSIGDLKMVSGIRLGYPLYAYNNEILYWRELEYNIYSIDINCNIQVKYKIDFGNYAFPLSENFKDEYDKLDFVKKNQNKVAGYIHALVENDDYLMFNYGYDSKVHLCIYDKQNKKTYSFTFKDGETYGSPGSQPDNSFLIVFSGYENENLTLHFVDVKTLLEKYGK
jgi:hypothetical protein